MKIKINISHTSLNMSNGPDKNQIWKITKGNNSKGRKGRTIILVHYMDETNKYNLIKEEHHSNNTIPKYIY